MKDNIEVFVKCNFDGYLLLLEYYLSETLTQTTPDLDVWVLMYVDVILCIDIFLDVDVFSLCLPVC